MDFFDRFDDVALLKRIRENARTAAQFTIIKGRRRIGKTTLLQHVYGEEDFLYFFVARKSEADLCADFQSEIERYFKLPLPGRIVSFEDVFKYLMELSKRQSFTLVIDEFQDFLRINASVYSTMQRDWDRMKCDSRMNLIVSGSINRMMELIFSSNQPLFGRATHEIDLCPFATTVVGDIMDRYAEDATADDLLSLWTLTGGVAKYVELLMDGRAFTREQMVRLAVADGSTFLNEGRALLVDEFGKDYATYFSILSSIASGRTAHAEIQSALGGNDIGGYLSKLRKDYRLIDRKTPFATGDTNRSVLYEIKDEFLRFWFRFVFKYQALVELRAYGRLQDIVLRDFDVFSGKALEGYFARKLAESGRYTAVGNWWDRRGENEIDIVAVDDVSRRILFAEVKRNFVRIDLDALRLKADAFLRAAGRYRDYETEYRGLSLNEMRKELS